MENAFIEMLYDDKSFIKLRREYKIIYGYYPEKLVTDYAKKVVLEPVHPCEEWCSPEVDYETELANISKNFEICHNAVQQFNKELAELVWRTDLLKKTPAANTVAAFTYTTMLQVVTVCQLNFQEES